MLNLNKAYSELTTGDGESLRGMRASLQIVFTLPTDARLRIGGNHGADAGRFSGNAGG
jgi:hypothetical protein